MVNMFGSTYSPLGDTNCDLLLKCRGKVKIQQGNKFIDLIKDGQLNISSSVIFDSSQVGNNDGIYIVNDKVYIKSGSKQIELNSGNTQVTTPTNNSSNNTSSNDNSSNNISETKESVEQIIGGLDNLYSPTPTYIIQEGSDLYIVLNNQKLATFNFKSTTFNNEVISNTFKCGSCKLYTYNGESYLYIDNIDVKNDNTLKFIVQNLTDTQKQQIFKNLGLDIKFDSIYNNLEILNIKAHTHDNKDVLDQITEDWNKQSDWNISDENDVAFIKNKPTNLSEFNNDAGYLTEPIIGYPIINTTQSTIEIKPNTYYKFGNVDSLNITFASSDSSYTQEYCFEFIANESTTLNLPDTVKWIKNPQIESGKTYQVSILNNIGVIIGC